MNRRQILQLGVASMIMPAAACQTKLTASKPYSQLGVQMYSVRKQFEKDYRTALKKLADIGYKDLEFASYYQHNLADIRSYMNELGLVSNAAHIGIDQFRNHFDEVLRQAEFMQQKSIILSWLAPEERLTIQQYQQHAKLLNECAEIAHQEGRQVLYHNHEFEFQAINGVVPYDVLLAETNPERIKFEIDLYWTAFAGIDVIDYFKRAPGRYFSCHIKDKAVDGSMTSVGKGTIDFQRIFEYVELAGLQHYYVEHDNALDPFASLASSFEYLNS